MAPKFEAEIQQLDDFTYVRLAGVIDEDNELAPLASRIRGVTAIIDLARVQDINNCGVRDWVKYLEELQERQIKVVLIECSPAIVSKLNTVGNFIKGGYVKSFYVPYFCQACEEEKALLVDIDELLEGPVRTPTCRCDSCDGVMAFDDLEESYFAFVKDVRKAVLPDSVRMQLLQLAPASGERKVLLRVAAGGSSFDGIPSSVSSDGGFGAGGSAVSPPSVATLRRLRDKTGLRTVRRPNVEAGTAAESSTRLRRLAVGAAILLVVLAGLVVSLVLLAPSR